MADPSRQLTASPDRAWVRLCQWLWDRRKFVWGTLIMGIIIGVSVNWLTSSTSIFMGTPLGTILLWIRDHLLLTGFIGVCLFFLTLFVGAVSALADTSTHVGTTSSQQSRSALIHLLRSEYRRQTSESLQGVTMMALALQQRTDVTLSSISLVSWRMDTSGEPSLPAPASIVEAYDEAGSGLLILGAPGAGKSTLLQQLASELLTRAEDDATQPIPVIVNFSSWAIKKPPLTSWLVEQLQLVYAIPRHLSQTWIEQNQLLLLLDGLDEMKPSARTNCIEVINAYRAEHFIPLVVCSRSQEYLTQEGRLRLPGAVEIQSLVPDQVDGYLKSAGKSMAAVRAALRRSAIMRGMVTTPLMLSIVMLAYHGKEAKDLPLLGSAEDQQRQLFNHYVTRMLEQQTRKWHYGSSQTQKWLIWLAQQMKHQELTEFYLERLQPIWLPTKRVQRLYPWLSGLTVGLFTGLLFGLSAGPRIGLRIGLLIGLLSMDIQPTEALSWSWRRLPRAATLGLLFGLLAGLLSGLLFGLLFGLSETQLDEHMRLKPNQGTHLSGWNALRIGLVLGLGTMLIFGFLGELVGVLVVGIYLGVTLGLILGLFYGGAAYLNHYILRLLLWRSRAVPWHYVRFLDEATERILLQRIGGGYRFIHPLFQDYFASLGTGTSASCKF